MAQRVPFELFEHTIFNKTKFKLVFCQVPLLIDQGTADGFLDSQLKPKNFFMAAAKNNYNVELRMQPLYDHSYYFISTFMRDHIDFHARALGLRPKL